ncbi:MAG: nucleotidyltransferase domain-containing protein [Cyclobacteriaceae bacterium]
MAPEIEKHRQELGELCKLHQVESCYIFGSGTRNDFDKFSDIDLLVRFSDSIDLLDYADNYFDLSDKLGVLLNRKVDLVSEKSLRNPVLIKEINKQKIPLYES